ncbi:hypothetical protein CDAR_622251 [Caerostris darwini]|uniref:Uncharacterized protein n=1 Tax=Caerostris darwini TaxID=1538125 RepID=A0AAV4QCI6_9ARAC|nr:hypothetical protein CDAR_622251 [Caerostris darwini]
MYSFYGIVGKLNSDLLAEDPENISICYFAVVLDFFDSLESGLLSGLEKTPIVFFSESVFLTFAYSVCTKLSSFGHVLGLVFAGVFLVNIFSFSVNIGCFHLVNGIRCVFQKFFENNFEEISDETVFEELRRFCDCFKGSKKFRESIINDALTAISEAIGSEINETLPNQPTLLYALKNKRATAQKSQIPISCLFCGTNCKIHLQKYIEILDFL